MSWLERLPDLVRECHERWELVGDGAFTDEFRYVDLRHVEPVRTRDGAAAVLELAPNVRGELAALEWFSGHGGYACWHPIASSARCCSSACCPARGCATWSADDEAATAAAAGLMGALWRPAPAASRFETVREWGEGLRRQGRAAGLYVELCDSMGEHVVLHGDLHHFNVLRSDSDGWLAIDPAGVVGEPAYGPARYCATRRPGRLELPLPAGSSGGAPTGWPRRSTSTSARHGWAYRRRC